MNFNTNNETDKISKLEMIVGQVGTLFCTAAHYLYKGLENVTPDKTTKDFNYFATSQYLRMGGGISAGLIADSLLSRAEEKLHIPKRVRGLVAMGLTVVGYAAAKHFFLNSDSSYNQPYLTTLVNTYADYWKAIASIVASEPRTSLPDMIGGTVMVTTTLRALKNLIRYHKS